MSSKLCNRLLCREISPQPGVYHAWPKKPGVPPGKPLEESDLLFTRATIAAAWVEKEEGEESHVKVLAVSDDGDSAEFYLKWVKIELVEGGFRGNEDLLDVLLCGRKLWDISLEPEEQRKVLLDLYGKLNRLLGQFLDSGESDLHCGVVLGAANLIGGLVEEEPIGEEPKKP